MKEEAGVAVWRAGVADVFPESRQTGLRRCIGVLRVEAPNPS